MLSFIYYFGIFAFSMVKIVVKNIVKDCKSRSEWSKERDILKDLSSAKESFAFRETKAADIPVTYVSGGKIYRETKEGRVSIGVLSPDVKVVK